LLFKIEAHATQSITYARFKAILVSLRFSVNLFNSFGYITLIFEVA